MTGKVIRNTPEELAKFEEYRDEYGVVNTTSLSTSEIKKILESNNCPYGMNDVNYIIDVTFLMKEGMFKDDYTDYKQIIGIYLKDPEKYGWPIDWYYISDGIFIVTYSGLGG